MGIFSTLEMFMLKKKIHEVAELMRDYTTFSNFTQLSMTLILLINVKMPTIVDILTFISKTNP